MQSEHPSQSQHPSQLEQQPLSSCWGRGALGSTLAPPSVTTVLFWMTVDWVASIGAVCKLR
jgi:hypothetical protein